MNVNAWLDGKKMNSFGWQYSDESFLTRMGVPNESFLSIYQSLLFFSLFIK